MDYRTAVDFCLDALGGKWKVLIIAHLSGADGGSRLTDILEEIPGLSRRVLIRELRELELADVVSRADFDEKPPRVEYTLTEHGIALEPIITSMQEWGLARIERLNAQLEALEESEAPQLIYAESWHEAKKKLAQLDPAPVSEINDALRANKLTKGSKELLNNLTHASRRDSKGLPDDTDS